MAEDAQKQSSLLPPPEGVRNQIYRLVAPHQESIQITAGHNDPEEEQFEEKILEFTHEALLYGQGFETFMRQAGESAEELTLIESNQILGVDCCVMTLKFAARASANASS